MPVGRTSKFGTAVHLHLFVPRIAARSAPPRGPIDDEKILAGVLRQRGGVDGLRRLGLQDVIGRRPDYDAMLDTFPGWAFPTKPYYAANLKRISERLLDWGPGFRPGEKKSAGGFRYSRIKC